MSRDLFGYDQPLPPRESTSVELTMALHDVGALSIEVSDPAKPGARRIHLPKSKIEYRLLGGGAVEVSVPQWLAKNEGLI